MPCIVQMNFDFDVTEEQLAARSGPETARMFWSVPGLRWKVWMRNPERKESGGIYLFADRKSAQAYVDGPIVQRVKTLPNSSNHSIKLFDVREEVSAITGAPLNVDMTRG